MALPLVRGPAQYQARGDPSGEMPRMRPRVELGSRAGGLEMTLHTCLKCGVVRDLDSVWADNSDFCPVCKENTQYEITKIGRLPP